MWVQSGPFSFVHLWHGLLFQGCFFLMGSVQLFEFCCWGLFFFSFMGDSRHTEVLNSDHCIIAKCRYVKKLLVVTYFIIHDFQKLQVFFQTTEVSQYQTIAILRIAILPCLFTVSPAQKWTQCPEGFIRSFIFFKFKMYLQPIKGITLRTSRGKRALLLIEMQIYMSVLIGSTS